MLAFQVQVVDREHARTLFDGKRHRNRSRPYGDNHRIGRNPLRERRIDLGVQADIHPKAIEQVRVGASQLVHIALEGKHLLGAEDAAELALALAQDDVVPAAGRRCRGDHASNAAAHDEHLARTGRARDVHPLEFASDKRVHRAAARLRHGTLGHAHVAAKAFHHIVAAIRHHLRGELGVGQKPARHGDGVGLTTRDDFFHLRGVGKPADRHDRNAHVLLDLGREMHVATVIAEHRRVRDREAKLIGPRRYMHEVDQILERMGDAGALGHIVAALEKLGSAYAQLNGESGANGAAHRSEHLAREADAVLKRPAVFVLALIEVGREELVDQPAVPRMHHNHLEAGTLRERSRLTICCNDTRNLLMRKRAHGHAVGAHAIGGPPLAQIALLLLVDHIGAGILPRMRKLDGCDRAVTFDRVGKVGEGAELTGRLQRQPQHLRAVGFGMDHQLAHGDDGRAALCAQLVESLGARSGRALRRDVGRAHRRR